MAKASVIVFPLAAERYESDPPEAAPLRQAIRPPATTSIPSSGKSSPIAGVPRTQKCLTRVVFSHPKTYANCFRWAQTFSNAAAY